MNNASDLNIYWHSSGVLPEMMILLIAEIIRHSRYNDPPTN